MKILSTILLCMFTLLQINAQQFVDTYIHIKPDYTGGSGELLILDCEDPNATVVKTVTFEGSVITSMQQTGITASGPKTLLYQASDGTNTYEFQAEINFDPMNPSITYSITPTVEPMSMIETFTSSSPACDGNIELIVSGGNVPYNISWFNAGSPMPGAADQTEINNLCPGSYGYTFGDNSTFCTGGNGSGGMMFNVDISLLDCFVDASDVSCFGMCDATASLVITGQGLGGIVMSDLMNDFGDSNPMILNDQCPGSINGIIYDRTGAMAQCFAMINEPDLINFDLTTTDLTSPGSNDGTAEVNVTQGAAPITYDWTGPNSYSSSGSSSISSLVDGGYTITMTYNNGQCDTTADFTIYDALQLNITSVDHQTSPTPNGAVNFTISGGAMPYDTIIDDGQTQMNGPFTELSAGEYTLIVTDDRGVTVNSTFTIESLVSVNEQSLDGFTMYPNPATSILNIEGEHLVSSTIYDLNGRAVMNTNLEETQVIDISNLESGIYTVNIRSEKGEHVQKLIVQ